MGHPEMQQKDIGTLFERYWRVVCTKAARPLGGVCLPAERVEAIATRVFDEFLETFDELPPKGEMSAFFSGAARREALEETARCREKSSDPDVFHEPEHALSENNLVLAGLQERSESGEYEGADWENLPAILRPRGASILRRQGVPEADIEDVFMECLALLVKPRPSDGQTPIEMITVFEEIGPLFTTMTHNYGVSWVRKQSTQRNRPNHPSYAESIDDPDRKAPPPADRDSGPWADLTFDRIYCACGDCLDELQWHILTALFVEANVTRGDLASDPWVLDKMGVDESASMGKKRRFLNQHLQSALDQLGNCLRTRDV